MAEHHKYIIFRCEKDDCWIVAVNKSDGDIYLGVAECPDRPTVMAVLSALRIRASGPKGPTQHSDPGDENDSQ